MDLVLCGSSGGAITNMNAATNVLLQRHSSLAVATSSSSTRFLGRTATTAIFFHPQVASLRSGNWFCRRTALCFSVFPQLASVETGECSQIATSLTTNGVDTGATSIANLEKDEAEEVQVAQGYTMTRFCDRMIEYFLSEKPHPKDWRKLLVFRDDWKKYRDHFYAHCQARANAEHDLSVKERLISLSRRIKKVDDEIEKHSDLLKEIQQNPSDLNAVVAKRRSDFTGNFFRYLNILSEVNDSLEERDATSRLGAKCLCAVGTYDNAINNLEMLEFAQSKFEDILNSHSLDAACEKIKNLAKAKEFDSSLILLINRAWAAAKESTTMKKEAKDVMHTIYKVARCCIKDFAPKEIKLLKQLLNITDPEERFSALATAFTPGSEHEAKEDVAIYTTPKELHKWIKTLVDAYNMNKEETDIREARDMASPVVIQRLCILMQTIEEEYLKPQMESKGVAEPL